MSTRCRCRGVGGVAPLAVGLLALAWLAIPAGQGRAAEEKLPLFSFDPDCVSFDSSGRSVIVRSVPGDCANASAVMQGLEWLVEHQLPDGRRYFEGDDLGSARGGRLHATALATMTLEVYYRHLSIYDRPGERERKRQTDSGATPDEDRTPPQ